MLYFGLAHRSATTRCCRRARCSRKDYQTRWAQYDKKAANKLLDELGLKRGADGLRLLPDGRPLEIIVETAGESTEQTDVLELIRDTWREVGIKLFTKPSQREVFRNRVFSGETMMSVWTGLENGIASADMSPDELAPTSQQQLQWPKLGQYYETSGKAGEAPDIPEAMELLKLYDGVARRADARRARATIWHAHARRSTPSSSSSIGMVSRRAAAGRGAQQRCATCRRRASTTGTRARTSASTGPTRSGSQVGVPRACADAC